MAKDELPFMLLHYAVLTAALYGAFLWVWTPAMQQAQVSLVVILFIVLVAVDQALHKLHGE